MTNSKRFKKRAVDIWKHLQKVNQLIYRELQKNFYDKGITTAQFDLLVALKKHKSLPMRKISELLSVTGGNVTGLIDRLEKKGLVERERSESGKIRDYCSSNVNANSGCISGELFSSHKAVYFVDY